jgi:ParB family chromosome partitioning protein
MIDRQEGCRPEKSGSSLVAVAPPNAVPDFKTPDAAATIARAEASDALDRSWTEGQSRAERFDAFRALGEEARAAWLGHAVARTLEASLNLPGDRLCRFHDHLGRLLGIDVAGWWRPTGANYFDRVPKGVTLAALEEVGGPTLADRYAKAKKTELARGVRADLLRRLHRRSRGQGGGACLGAGGHAFRGTGRGGRQGCRRGCDRRGTG